MFTFISFSYIIRLRREIIFRTHSASTDFRIDVPVSCGRDKGLKVKKT